eukprot:CAMPEP_0195053876 /NCGR_PEP_ID=MMETSP0448-20130528/2894_1 /TAXON_ID=66468 /ORGANISM="Heterocapsa triquestra, Strain CCMP 448" /LENGTH=40 /DNA_ID= /DNA_START= /DNA_END= /DNA_ORIENTATION=
MPDPATRPVLTVPEFPSAVKPKAKAPQARVSSVHAHWPLT